LTDGIYVMYFSPANGENEMNFVWEMISDDLFYQK